MTKNASWAVGVVPDECGCQVRDVVCVCVWARACARVCTRCSAVVSVRFSAVVSCLLTKI